MFGAEPESASFVENAMTSGFEFLRCAFAAMVTAVSVIPWFIFAMVFPVQGAIMSASIGFAGPRGSASAIECTGCAPHSELRRDIKSADVPKRVSVARAERADVSVSLGRGGGLAHDGHKLVFIGKDSKLRKQLIVCAVRAAKGDADSRFAHDITPFNMSETVEYMAFAALSGA